MQTRARSEEAKTSRRMDLVAAALRLFSVHGYAGTTIEAIAAEAGLSPAAFYNYFPSKVEIYRAINMMAVEELNTSFSLALLAVEEAAGTEDDGVTFRVGARRARARLEALAGAYLRFFDEHRDLYLVAEVLHLGAGDFFAQGIAHEGSAPLLEAGAMAILSIVREVLAEGESEGELRPVDPWETALALWAMLDGVLIAAVKRAEEYTGVGHERVAARALEIMLDGIAESRRLG